MEKWYDYLLIGATFWSVGFAQAAKGSCCIVEPRTRVGYEFIDAFQIEQQDVLCVTEEGRAFQTELKRRGIIRDGALALQQACAPMLCHTLKESGVDILFTAEVTEIVQTDQGYQASLFTPSGILPMRAGYVADTTARSVHARKHQTRKWINAMLYADCRDVESYDDWYQITPGEREEIAYLRVPVSVDATWDEARTALFTLLRRREPPLRGYRLISIASAFSYEYDAAQWESVRPSDSYSCFLEAFDQGAQAGKEKPYGFVSVV